MIVVEGPDGSGKTTLLTKIKEETGLDIAPRVVSKDTEAMVDLTAWVEENVERGWHPTLYDRHRLISEPIYGPAVRQSLEPGFDDPYWFHTMLQRFYHSQPLIIFCLPPLEVVQANIFGDPDNIVVADKIRQIWAGYFNLMCTHFALSSPQHHPVVIHYDFTEPNDDRNIVHLLRRIRSETRRKTGIIL